MEVGTEISQKIRSAIKAKLIELGAYVDDELPDYIMVMVANKKNREQMVSDLSLFLGGNTDAFAEWLHGLLGKLQTISVDSKDVKEKKKAESKKEKKTKKNSTSQGKNKSVSGPGASSKKNKSLALEDAKVIENKKNSETVSKSEDKEDNSEGQSNDVEDVRQLLVTGTPTDELAAELETTEATIEQSKIVQQKKTSVSSPSKGTTHSKVTVTSQHKRSASPSIERKVQSTRVPAKKFKGLTSVVASVSKGAEEDEEYDPLCPAVGNVASVVKVTSRKSKVPPALQANSILGEEQTSDINYDTDGHPGSTMVRLGDTASIERIRSVLMNVIKQDQEDDTAAFCRSIESSLRKMNQRNVAIAKIRIQRILFDYESTLNANSDKLLGPNAASSSQGQANTNSLSSSSSHTDSAKTLSSENNVNNSSSSGDKIYSNHDMSGTKGRWPDHGKVSSIDSKLHPHPESPSTSQSSPATTRPEDSVSSSRNDLFSPFHHDHQQPKVSDSSRNQINSEIASMSSASSFHSIRPRSDIMQSSTSNNRFSDSPTQAISLDSLHQKRHLELEYLGKGTSSVLRIRPLLHNVQNVTGGSGGNGDNSGPDSPKPISAEQLKVLAKNLKITVTNSRALKSKLKSNSNNDSSSDDDSEEETDDSDDESEEDEENVTSISKSEVEEISKEGKIGINSVESEITLPEGNGTDSSHYPNSVPEPMSVNDPEASESKQSEAIVELCS